MKRGSDVVRIVQLITHMYELGGAQMHVYELSKRLKLDSNEVFLLAAGECELTVELKNKGVNYQKLKWMGVPIKPYNDARAFFEVRKTLKEIQPDIVALHSSKAGLIGRAAAKSLNIPVVFTAHGWSFAGQSSTFKKTLYLTLERWTAKIANGVIAVSNYDYNQALYHRVVGTEKLKMIHNGIPDDDRCLTKYKKNDSFVDLLMIARFAEPKDHALLLKSLQKIPFVHWRLTLLGDGPLFKTIQKLAKDYGIENNVIFAGEDRDIITYMKKADIFVLISKSEGLPLSIIEGMRQGVPIIASDVGGVNELFYHGQQGFLVPRSDEERLKQKLMTLMSSEPLRKKFGKSARNRYLNEFAFEKMHRQTTLYYKELTDKEANKIQKEVQL